MPGRRSGGVGRWPYRVRAKVLIAASPREVFSFLTDREAMHKLSPDWVYDEETYLGGGLTRTVSHRSVDEYTWRREAERLEYVPYSRLVTRLVSELPNGLRRESLQTRVLEPNGEGTLLTTTIARPEFPARSLLAIYRRHSGEKQQSLDFLGKLKNAVEEGVSVNRTVVFGHKSLSLRWQNIPRQWKHWSLATLATAGILAFVFWPGTGAPPINRSSARVVATAYLDTVLADQSYKAPCAFVLPADYGGCLATFKAYQLPWYLRVSFGNDAEEVGSAVHGDRAIISLTINMCAGTDCQRTPSYNSSVLPPQAGDFGHAFERAELSLGPFTRAVACERVKGKWYVVLLRKS